MSLLKWDWQFRIEGGVHVRNYVAKERDKYLFEIGEVMRLLDDTDPEVFGCRWQKAYLLTGYVIDNKYHTHPLQGWFCTEEDAMDAAEAALVTAKLEGKL